MQRIFCVVMLGQDKTNNLDCTNISRVKIASILFMCLGWVVKSGWKEILGCVWGGGEICTFTKSKNILSC